MQRNLFHRFSFQGFKSKGLIKGILPKMFLGFLFLFFIGFSAKAQRLEESALEQVRSLMAEKESRSEAQKKISSQILYTLKMYKGQPITDKVEKLETGIEPDEKGLIKVDMKAKVTPDILNTLRSMDCNIIWSSEKFHSIVAFIPILDVEKIAEQNEITFIHEWVAPTNNNPKTNEGKDINNLGPVNRSTNPLFNEREKLPFEKRGENVKNQFLNTLGGNHFNAPPVPPAFVAGSISEADRTHKAALARAVFGVNGSGVKIGVLSDSYDKRTTGTDAADDILSGDLPGPGNPNGFTTPVTVLLDAPGASNDEGRAMLHLIHDLAPGAQLYFATAFISQASFAQQILDLRAAGCDIIVDDVSYFREGVFQDDNVAQAVNAVTADGALYFSSAGNSGNKNDNTSGVWEGDFVDMGYGDATYEYHNFGGGVDNNQITATTGVLTLKWSDPLGLSGNDYDLFVFNSTQTTVLASSTSVQDGNDDPYEAVSGQAALRRIIIVKKVGAQNRALHLNSNRGRLSINTSGVVYGHNAGANTLSVAATPAARAFNSTSSTGPFPLYFNSTNEVERFSSDGPRKIFYHPDSTAITAGNFLFNTNGGTNLQKPDFTAADGTVTNTPGFERFYGTSAAAPHAAAIAGLIKSKLPGLTSAQIIAALNASAIDIEAAGVDRDAGSGIIMAYEALIAAGATSSLAYLDKGVETSSEGSYGNGNGIVEPGELGSLTVQLLNGTVNTATGVTGVLTTSTPGVIISTNTVQYGDIAGGNSITNTANPFVYGLSSGFTCGTVINFTLTLTYGGGLSPQQFSIAVKTSQIPVISGTIGSPVPTGTGYTSTSGIQTGRINRFDPASTCAVPKLAPGYLATTGSRDYHAFTFTNFNATEQCVTVSTQVSNSGTVYIVAYNNAGFIPATPNENYLADPGAFGANDAMSFNVPAGQNFTIVVHELNVASGAGTSYNLDVDLKNCPAVPICTPVVVAPASIAGGNINVPYSQAFSATGGSGAYLFSISAGTLPTGLNFSGDSISGTPTQSGSFPITVQAVDATGCPAGTKDYTLEIASGLTIWYRDTDDDGFGRDGLTKLSATKPLHYSSQGGDCNDKDNTIYPGAPELPDGKDNNCNGQTDEGLTGGNCKIWYRDTDGDGYGRDALTKFACSQPNAYAALPGDCKDKDPAIHPGVLDICDGIDNDCDGTIDENCPLLVTSVNKKSMKETDEVGSLSIAMYPNPVKTELIVTLNAFEPNQKMEISLLQVDGKVQQSQSLMPTVKGQQVRLNVSNAVTGFYVLQVKQGSKTSIEKVMVLK